jgi:hypothetical protein
MGDMENGRATHVDHVGLQKFRLKSWKAKRRGKCKGQEFRNSAAWFVQGKMDADGHGQITITEFERLPGFPTMVHVKGLEIGEQTNLNRKVPRHLSTRNTLDRAVVSWHAVACILPPASKDSSQMPAVGKKWAIGNR